MPAMTNQFNKNSPDNLCIVVGLGLTGLSCVRYLQARGFSVAVADTRIHPPGLATLQTEFPAIEFVGGALTTDFLLKAQEIILSPGVSLQEPAIQACLAQQISVVGDIELFARANTQPVIAITGSNAKSTVTTLVHLMARQAGCNALVAGNIGMPVLDLLTQPVADLYILELSSFQLETTFSLAATAATILNISADHLDRYQGLAAYTAAKQRVYQQAKHVICNRDDQATYPVKLDDTLLINFGLSAPKVGEFGIRLQDQDFWLAYGDELLMPTQTLRIKGRHNWANALAALALGHTVGLPFKPMLAVLAEFPGLAHRCEWLAEHQGIHWYNDSKGTNVGATVAALAGIGANQPGKIILIAGGDGKGAEFTDLVPAVANYVRLTILIGKDAQRLGACLQDVTAIQYANNLVAAVQMAANAAQAGDSVLLSPACSSLDMFQNYEHRGRVFQTAVKELLA